MKKVLIITYYWPPGSGAGVQRWLKFAGYLPSFGWEPVILTVDPAYASFPATDSSLENETETIRVFRTKATDYFRLYGKKKEKVPAAGFATGNSNSLKEKIARFIRGNFFIPDPRRGWNKFAFEKACDLINIEGINHIITTSPPHSTQLIGLKLKKKFPGIKWVADLRDPWTDIYYYSMFYPTRMAKYIDSCYERKVLAKADKIITVGKTLGDLYSSKVESVKGKIGVITNGYDEKDFENVRATVPGIFTISYIGTLASSYPIDGFLKAVRELAGRGQQLLLRFAGYVPEYKKQEIRNSVGNTRVEFTGYVSHSEAISYMMQSSVLLLIIPEHESSKSILTGKLFEYLASRKPVLCLGPADGDAADILKNSGAGKCFEYADHENIQHYIDGISEEPHTERKTTGEYTRRQLTSKLVDLMKDSN